MRLLNHSAGSADDRKSVSPSVVAGKGRNSAAMGLPARIAAGWPNTAVAASDSEVKHRLQSASHSQSAEARRKSSSRTAPSSPFSIAPPVPFQSQLGRRAGSEQVGQEV